MIDQNVQIIKRHSFNDKWVIAAILLTMIGIFVFFGVNSMNAVKAEPSQSQLSLISETQLKERYGIQFPFVAVTAAGGLIDVRIQIVDGEKAKSFLEDQKNFPKLFIGKDTVLTTSEDSLAQDIQFEKGKFIFLLYPNSGNVLKSGDPLNLVFNNMKLEEIYAK